MVSSQRGLPRIPSEGQIQEASLSDCCTISCTASPCVRYPHSKPQVAVHRPCCTRDVDLFLQTVLDPLKAKSESLLGKQCKMSCYILAISNVFETVKRPECSKQRSLCKRVAGHECNGHPWPGNRKKNTRSSLVPAMVSTIAHMHAKIFLGGHAAESHPSYSHKHVIIVNRECCPFIYLSLLSLNSWFVAFIFLNCRERLLKHACTRAKSFLIVPLWKVRYLITFTWYLSQTLPAVNSYSLSRVDTMCFVVSL